MDINKIFESWQVKILASYFITCFTFLVGNIEAPFIAIWVLVAIDTLTRWTVISKRTLEQQGLNGSIIYGFYLSWHTGALNSHTMRTRFMVKILGYFTLIVAGNLVGKIIPSLILFGNDIAKFPGGFVYSFLAVTELMSIIENLIEMGMDLLKPLAVWASNKRNEMTGGSNEAGRYENH